VTGDSISDSYAFLRGRKGNQYQSFPSGHTTAAFSLAAAVTAETSHWIDRADAWPGWKLVIGGSLAGAASMLQRHQGVTLRLSAPDSVDRWLHRWCCLRRWRSTGGDSHPV
jgi:hypothetical protein